MTIGTGSHNEGLTDREVIDRAGEKVGKVTDVIFDEAELERPAWLVVNPGLLKAEHYVPAVGAVPEGDDRVVIPYDVDLVKSSPKATNDHTMTNVIREVLRDHYHLADA